MPQFFETNFDERSGIIQCKTPWGFWYQTVAEVHIEINVEPGTLSRNIKVIVKPKFISVKVADKMLFEGQLYSMIIEDEMLWTLEDRKLIHIVLSKADVQVKETLWEGLLKDQFAADPYTILEMRKKLDLERFEIQNPGMNFTNAKLKTSYDQPPETAISDWENREKTILKQMENDKKN